MTTDSVIETIARKQDLKSLDQYGAGPAQLSGMYQSLYDRHLVFDNVIERTASDSRDRFEAFARSVRDILSQRWVLTGSTYDRLNPKRVYYLSIEFLIGRSLANNVANLLVDPAIREAARHHSINWDELVEEEPDAALGNGGLGRLAACFLDSMATMQLPAMGYGLRYEYGIFKQSLKNGWQQEQPDNWLRRPDPWEVARHHEWVEVKLNASFKTCAGELCIIPGRPSSLLGIPYDRPIVGYGGETVNTLRLWEAAAPDYFDFQAFSHGDFVGAVAERLEAESLTRVLYPDDSTSLGQGLRFVQEYFLVACSLADMVRRFRQSNSDWQTLPRHVAIQLNDTHPSMAVPELMRILLDDARLGWDKAWELTQETLAYTNHTLLPEALEKWPLEWFQQLLPRHLEIILEINRRLLATVRSRYPGDEGRVERVSLVEETPQRKIRMANLAIVGSHSTNGVAAIHSQLLRTMTVRDLAEVFPERFNNKTNGMTPRRWLHLSNPALAGSITEAIGDGWITDLDQLRRLEPLAADAAFSDSFLDAKRTAKLRFARWLRSSSGQVVDPDSIFDCHIKRIHEYKRQLLNALRIVVLYNRLRENPRLDMRPRTFFFAGKAAPAYRLAKLIIKFINNLAGTIDGDAAMRDRIKVLFLPEYDVTLAERLIPASDVSNQISTAGYEASGTSNMKFMMNGALTVGTRDGATIEMAEEAGEDNFFLFGLTAEQVAGSRGWYNPHWHYQNDPETRAALDLIFSDHFSRNEPGVFEPLRDTLLTHGDFYMHLADLPMGAPNARLGQWVAGPAADFFQAAKKELGSLPFIAEDLGLITPDVIQLRDSQNLPGMRVLQFAFDGNPENPHLPRNYDHNNVAYTGTHDNNTTRGWFETLSDQQKRNLWSYLGRAPGESREAAPELMRLAWSSPAALAIAPMQDMLDPGGDARMNVPGQAADNWRWRMTDDLLAPPVFDWLRDLTEEARRAVFQETFQEIGVTR